MGCVVEPPDAETHTKVAPRPAGHGRREAGADYRSHWWRRKRSGSDEIRHRIQHRWNQTGRKGFRQCQVAKTQRYRRSFAKGSLKRPRFSAEGIPTRLPVAADAHGWPHFLEGGTTAVRLPDSVGSTGRSITGYLVNAVHEYVILGGTPLPPGGFLFKLGADGNMIVLRRFQ